MILTIMLWLGAAFVILTCLAIVGRRKLVKAIQENNRLGLLVRDFHQELVTYANSNGEDQVAFREMTMKSAAVERALGNDNIVNGVQIGMYMLNNANILPLAIQEMRRAYGDGTRWYNNGGEIADIIQTVVFRHIGKRADIGDNMLDQASRLWPCIAAGWSALSELPIFIIFKFGLISATNANAAKKSFLFRLWNFVLALATIVAPILAYFADREKIDAAIRLFIN